MPSTTPSEVASTNKEEEAPPPPSETIIPSNEDPPISKNDSADDKVPLEKDVVLAAPQEDADAVTETHQTKGGVQLFHHMAKTPWPYLIFWPVLFCFLIGFGWTRDDIIEDEVTNIWIPTRGGYATDVAYAANLGEDDLAASSFAAMAIARDGGNLFTASRLEEIRQRMERTERTTITYKGVKYYWEDFCTSNGGFPYEFPCSRLSPMDLFQEANWFMDFTGAQSYNNDTVPAENQDLYRRTWYKDLIQETLVQPRIPRFGVMTTVCAGQCLAVLSFRYAQDNSFALFADIGNLEMNDPCRICIEDEYTATIDRLNEGVRPLFLGIAGGLEAYIGATGDTSVDGIKTSAEILSQTISSDDVEQFYFYYVTRGVYGQLGADAYAAAFPVFARSCQLLSQLGAVCPNSTSVDISEAEEALRNHADGPFSSLSTAGSPFPFWGEGGGFLFEGNFPVGGSGIDMSSNITTLQAYLESTVLIGQLPDPNSLEWEEQVEKNPIYAWFMASLTPADEGTACGNDFLKGTNFPEPIFAEINQNTTYVAMAATQRWCTKYSIPNTNNTGQQESYTKQHFARMWYDLLIDSDSFLGIQEGVDDPYTWTTGQGCGYELRGQRDSYSGMSESSILQGASRPLYYIDEGESVGVLNAELILGDVTPSVSEYSAENPLEEVGVIQSLYAALLPRDIVQRVRHCERPDGPVEITLDDAEELLFEWKEAMENAWTEGWDDDDAGEVQFVAFFDDSAVVGTTGRMLKEITLDNNTLTAVAIVFIALFSALFLFSFDAVASRVLITLVGVTLVVLAYFSAIGFAILIGEKVSVTIAWTLPFIILGLGVDDMYIVLMAVKKQGGYQERHFLDAMKEVIVPVTMTSLVNASMFAILNVSDIPAIYITAQVAVYCVILLYCAIVFCYPAYVYLDMRRQAAGRKDLFFCIKQEGPPIDPKKEDFREIWLYDRFYKPLMLGEQQKARMISHSVIWLMAAALFATGCYGITQREVGLGLEDFFPSTNPAGTWATVRTESLASWSIGINWGALDYTDPTTQLKMIKQFEDVVATPHVAEVDTKRLWLADFLMWTTTHCEENFDRENFDILECGRDQIFATSTNLTCSATWVSNEIGLREKTFQSIMDEVCYPHEGGICRPGTEMHPVDLIALGLDPTDPDSYQDESYCPTIDGWSDAQWQFCLVQWRNTTGYTGGRFILEEDLGSPISDCQGSYNNDENFTWPIPFSSGPTMFAFDLFSHQETLDMMEETRSICDDDEDLHCWLTGIPFDYWTQYEGIFTVLVELAVYTTVTGFAIAFIFLFGKLSFEKRYTQSKIFVGSLIGACLITVTIILSLVTVVGISILAGVSLTGFSNMSFVLSVGFAVEYSVHIVSRWLRAPLSIETGLDRVKHTMSFLMLPTFMSFVSSLIGVICLAFTEFEFCDTFFFKPLIIVMFATYFFGCWWLPSLLTLLNFDVVKLGKQESAMDTTGENQRAPPSGDLPTGSKHSEGAEEEGQQEQPAVLGASGHSSASC